MELGEEKERISGGHCFTYEYKEEGKVFFNKDAAEDVIKKEWLWYQVLDEDEDFDYEDIDPQF